MVIKYVVIILGLKNLRFIGKYQKLIVQPFLNYPNLIKSSYNSKTSSGPNRPAAAIGGVIFQVLWLHGTNFSSLLEDYEHPDFCWQIL